MIFLEILYYILRQSLERLQKKPKIENRTLEKFFVFFYSEKVFHFSCDIPM
jgi:hypothetical protein